jgi:hypothetical protein
MRLGIGTITYNDRVGLERLIESIDYDYVDKHFIIDGKFPNQNGKFDYSNDGTAGFLLGCYHRTNGKVLSELLVSDESVKRQRYLTLCAEHDIDALIILDSDEYVDKQNTNWPKFRNEISEAITEQSNSDYIHNVYSLDENYYGTIKERPRLWIYPSQMEYMNGLHFAFKNKYHNFGLDMKSKVKGRMYALKKQFSFRFINDNRHRPKMRRVEHDTYQNWLVPHEIELSKDMR